MLQKAVAAVEGPQKEKNPRKLVNVVEDSEMAMTEGCVRYQDQDQKHRVSSPAGATLDQCGERCLEMAARQLVEADVVSSDVDAAEEVQRYGDCLVSVNKASRLLK